MPEASADMPRRAALVRAVGGGVALATGGRLGADAAGDEAGAPIERVVAPGEWFSHRAYSVSGNKVLTGLSGSDRPATTRARQVYRPRSAEEIAGLVRSSPVTTPIACVCGGHESSNAALVASADAIVLDLVHLKSIDFHEDDHGTLVTVGAGVVFRELVEAVKGRHGALPVGTGPGVGVIGYVVNGGLSGYFSRRLGLLGQRVVALTLVTAAGDIEVVTPVDERFTAMLGAGSALGVVVDVTIRMEHESVVRGAEQRVVSFETRDQAVAFVRGALRIQRDRVLPNESVSMELVVTGTKAMVVTVVFYDSFAGDMAEFVKPLEDLAASLRRPIVGHAHWGSWYEAAAALWPVLTAMKGDPLAMLQHCMGTTGAPDDGILDFISDTVVARAPLDDAELSIVEIRTLGGAVLTKPKLPSGNCHHRFFVDVITLYDAKHKSLDERRAITGLVRRLIGEARGVNGLSVDFSGTHSQPDDADSAVSAPVIFGSEAMAEAVLALKKKIDPGNRFRFHPYARLLG